MNWKRIVPLTIAVFLLGRYFLGNSGFTEEGRVLQVIAQTAEAVEEKDREKLADVLSENYSDRTGLDKTSMLDLAQRYFNSRNRIEIIRLGSDVEFPNENQAVGKIRYQVIGSIDGALYRGFRDSSSTGERLFYSLAREEGEWKIVSIDPERGTWR